jgi:hypothetical protein
LGDVGWHNNRHIVATLLAPAGCGFDRSGLAFVSLVLDHSETKFGRQHSRLTIAGHKGNIDAVSNALSCRHHVAQHRLSELSPLRRVQSTSQPLLGTAEILNGNQKNALHRSGLRA